MEVCLRRLVTVSVMNGYSLIGEVKVEFKNSLVLVGSRFIGEDQYLREDMVLLKSPELAGSQNDYSAIFTVDFLTGLAEITRFLRVSGIISRGKSPKTLYCEVGNRSFL